MTQHWVPEIMYEGESDESLTSSIPFIPIPEGEEMPRVLFIFESRETGAVEPGPEGEELSVTELELHQYADMLILKNRLKVTVVGHTHRPRFPEPGDIPLFNDGSCVHPRSITGIEIEKGSISLIKWQINTTDDGTLRVVRILLEGPQKLKDYVENT